MTVTLARVTDVGKRAAVGERTRNSLKVTNFGYGRLCARSLAHQHELNALVPRWLRIGAQELSRGAEGGGLEHLHQVRPRQPHIWKAPRGRMCPADVEAGMTEKGSGAFPGEDDESAGLPCQVLHGVEEASRHHSLGVRVLDASTMRSAREMHAAARSRTGYGMSADGRKDNEIAPDGLVEHHNVPFIPCRGRSSPPFGDQHSVSRGHCVLCGRSPVRGGARVSLVGVAWSAPPARTWV